MFDFAILAIVVVGSVKEASTILACFLRLTGNDSGVANESAAIHAGLKAAVVNSSCTLTHFFPQSTTMRCLLNAVSRSSLYLGKPS